MIVAGMGFAGCRGTRCGRRSSSKEEVRPSPDEEVEAGYVFLRVYEGDAEAALAQTEFFLATFPESRRAIAFRKLRTGLEQNVAAGGQIRIREWGPGMKGAW